MPWSSELAQLPTPTIATRTLPSPWRALAAAAGEGDGEAGGEDADGDVVEVGAAGGDLLGEPLLQLGRHPDEHVLAHALVIADMCYRWPSRRYVVSRPLPLTSTARRSKR